MQRYQQTILARGTGMALADALVTVYLTGTATKADIYSEDDVTSDELANPLTSDAYGMIDGYIPDGEYDFRIDHGSFPSYTIEEVQIYDLSLLAEGEMGPLGTLEGNANQLPYFAGENIVALAEFYQVGRNFLAATTLEEQQELLGLAALGGGDMLAANNLSDLANPATSRTNLGVAIGADVQAYRALLDTIDECTDAEGWAGDDTDEFISPRRLFTLAAPVTLVDAATVAVDLDTGINFTVTLAGNRTLGNPTNGKVGQSGTIYVTQDGTGSRTLALGANWKPIGGAPTLSTAAGTVDVFAYFVRGAAAVTLSYLGAEG